MGEAKRRHDRLKSRSEMTLPTGEKVVVRHTDVTPRQMLVQILDNVDRHARGERFDVSVPCEECRECCWHHRINVFPEEELPEHLTTQKLEQDKDGWFIPKREDGACIHLTPVGCGIHDSRPRGCRVYDCRTLAMGSEVEAFDNGHYSPRWRFPSENLDDRAILAACHLRLRTMTIDYEMSAPEKTLIMVLEKRKGLTFEQDFEAARVFLKAGLISFDYCKDIEAAVDVSSA